MRRFLQLLVLLFICSCAEREHENSAQKKLDAVLNEWKSNILKSKAELICKIPNFIFEDVQLYTEENDKIEFDIESINKRYKDFEWPSKFDCNAALSEAAMIKREIKESDFFERADFFASGKTYRVLSVPYLSKNGKYVIQTELTASTVGQFSPILNYNVYKFEDNNLILSDLNFVIENS